MEKQKTIKEKVSFEGVGLHTGKEVKVTLIPAQENSGIFFFREDRPALIKADFYSILNPDKFPRRTSIGKDGVYVHTIEHLMAALSISGIDNLQINLDGEEIPGMDGSAAEFIEAIKRAGVIEQSVSKYYLSVKDPIWVDEEKSGVVILPYNGYRITYTLDYDSPYVPTDFIDIDFHSETLNHSYFLLIDL